MRELLFSAITDRLDADGRARGLDILRAVRANFEALVKWAFRERCTRNPDDDSLRTKARTLGFELAGNRCADATVQTWDLLCAVVHTPDSVNERIPSESAYVEALCAVYELHLRVTGVEEAARDDELEHFREQVSSFPVALEPAAQRDPPNTTPFLRLVVEAVEQRPNGSWVLTGKWLPDGHDVRIHWDGGRPPKGIEPLMRVGVHQITCTARRHYKAGRQTIVVVEPDLMLPVKYLSESIVGTWETFLAKQLLSPPPGPANEHILVGELVERVVIRCLVHHESLEQAEQRVREESAERYEGVTLVQNEKPRKSNIASLLTHLGKATASSEIPYLSPQQGVEGNVDLATTHSSVKYLEIKSSAPFKPKPGQTASPKHDRQVRWYQLLQADVDGVKPQTHHVFYAGVKANNAPLVSIEHSRHQVTEAHHDRNEVVCALLAIKARLEKAAADDVTLFAGADLGYPEEKQWLDSARARWKTAPRELRILWRWLVEFGVREELARATGLHANEGTAARSDLWLLDLDAKLERGDTTSPGKVRATTRDTLTIAFDTPRQDALRQDDRVVVIDPSRPEVWRGILSDGSLSSASPTEVVVRLDRPIEGSFCIPADMEVRIERKVYGLSWTLLGTLQHLFMQPKPARTLIGLLEPTSNSQRPIPSENLLEGLEGNQREALIRACQADRGFLIQGPPGSGKTKLVIARLAYHAAATARGCVVLTQTHRAAEEAFEAIKTLYEHRGEPADSVVRITNNVVSANARVVVCTLQRYARIPSRPENHLLIVDEASQIKDGDLLGVLCLFSRFVLVGDHRQLPPICSLDEEHIPEAPEELRELGFSMPHRSTFERLWFTPTWAEMRIQLTHHYRMHADIAATIEHAYDAALIPSKLHQSLPADDGTLQALGRVLHIPSEGDPKNKTHDGEVESVVKLCRRIKAEHPQYEIMVATPWRRQVVRIRQALQEAQLEVKQVDTVERLQGGECDVIIISMATTSLAGVRSPASEGLDGSELHNVDRKLLVALSRAKELVVLLAHDQLRDDDDRLGGGQPGSHYRTVLRDHATRVIWNGDNLVPWGADPFQRHQVPESVR